MEWEPKEQGAWVSDAQRWICQINGVLQCKIDLDSGGEIAGVHVVAGMERDPRHIVRDVEGLLKARLDIDVYYKKIGVVQVVDNGLSGEVASAAPTEPRTGAAANQASDTVKSSPAKKSTGIDSSAQPVSGSAVTFHPPRRHEGDPPETYPTEQTSEPNPSQDVPDAIPAILVAEDLGNRVVCEGVGVMASDATIRAEVQLRAGKLEAGGLCEGANHADADMQLVAQATVEAVADLIADPILLHLKEVRLEQVGGHGVVLTAVDLVEGRQSTTLFGTCSTSHNRLQAVVYSVLDALNRRIALHGLKELEGTG